MIARILWTIIQYPVGAEVGFQDEFITEYRTVLGYEYVRDVFYVLFSDGGKVRMNRLDELVVSVTIKKEVIKCKRVKR